MLKKLTLYVAISTLIYSFITLIIYEPGAALALATTLSVLRVLSYWFTDELND